MNHAIFSTLYYHYYYHYTNTNIPLNFTTIPWTINKTPSSNHHSINTIIVQFFHYHYHPTIDKLPLKIYDETPSFLMSASLRHVTPHIFPD